MYYSDEEGMKWHVPNGSFYEFGVRPANDEDLLHTGEREALKGPVQQKGVAYREQALMKYNFINPQRAVHRV